MARPNTDAGQHASSSRKRRGLAVVLLPLAAGAATFLRAGAFFGLEAAFVGLALLLGFLRDVATR